MFGVKLHLGYTNISCMGLFTLSISTVEHEVASTKLYTVTSYWSSLLWANHSDCWSSTVMTREADTVSECSSESYTLSNLRQSGDWSMEIISRAVGLAAYSWAQHLPTSSWTVMEYFYISKNWKIMLINYWYITITIYSCHRGWGSYWKIGDYFAKLSDFLLQKLISYGEPCVINVL